MREWAALRIRRIVSGEIASVAPGPRRTRVAHAALALVSVASFALSRQRAQQRLGVLDDVLEPDCRVTLHRRAKRLERDVVEAAVEVAAGRVALRRGAVRVRVRVEARDLRQGPR
eukprot:3373334-Pleurochrysis_carterae.AAC.3